MLPRAKNTSVRYLYESRVLQDALGRRNRKIRRLACTPFAQCVLGVNRRRGGRQQSSPLRRVVEEELVVLDHHSVSTSWSYVTSNQIKQRVTMAPQKSMSASTQECSAGASVIVEETTRRTPPLVSFGLISDVQYADIDDGWNYMHTAKRFYRNSLKLLRDAVDEWVQVHEAAGASSSLRFAVNLGDLIDGKNKPLQQSETALEGTKAICDGFEARVGPFHHLVGNHELYNFSQRVFDEKLRWKEATETYYDFVLAECAPKVRFVVLNPYGVSSIGREEADPVFQQARSLLLAANDNEDLNSSLGIEGLLQRYVEYNGAVDATQLVWLEQTLQRAQEAEEHVILFTHIPLHPRSSPANCLLWNYDEVMRVINATKCVRVVFSGHIHANGYVEDEGVHYVVCNAVLECSPAETSHALVDVYEDHVVVNGYGTLRSRTLRFPDTVNAQSESKL